MVDKGSLTILAFLVVFVVLAAIISMGAIPVLFKTATDVNQTNILLAQRIALTDSQKHEDLARFNQTQHEDEARDKQVVVISNHIDKQIDRLQFNLLKFIRESENRSSVGAAERNEILKKLNIALNNQEAQLSNQDSKLKMMQGQQDSINNITKNTLDLLNKLGKEFGKGNHQLAIENKQLLENLTNNIEEIRNIINK